MKKLYIIDLSKNYFELSVKNCDVIYLDAGNVSHKNIEKLKIRKLNQDKYAKKIFIEKLSKKIIHKKDYFFKEFEIFNLRNDKNIIISKILNLIKIKNFLKKNKKYEVHCISDNQFTYDIINQLAAKKINNEFHNKVKSNFFKKKNFSFYFLKFIIKVIFILLFIKLYNQNKLIKALSKNKKSWAMSLYPNFFKDKKEIFFGENFNKINFLISDETHLNFSFLKLLNIYFSNQSKILNLESFISFKDIFYTLIKIFKNKKKYNKYLNENLIIDNLDFTGFYQESIMNSFINRSKLMIYDNAIKKFKKYYSFKKFHIYLFEYNFGFYLTRNLKQLDCEIIGYQHGIFNDDVMWLDILTYNNEKVYFPNKIIANYKNSLNKYKNKFYKNLINFKYKRRNISKIAYLLKIKKNLKEHKKILILSGTHDIKDIYFYCKNSINLNKKITYHIKAHPKNRFIFESEKRIKKINNINRKYYDKIIVSSTSTISYDLKLLNKKFDIFKADYKST